MRIILCAVIFFVYTPVHSMALPSVIYKFTNGPMYLTVTGKQQKTEFETRRYWASWWLAVKEQCDGPNVNLTSKYRILESYFKGYNRRKELYEITNPQLARFKLRPGKECPESVSQLLYLPHDPATRPPKPSSRYLMLIDTPAMQLVTTPYINERDEWDRSTCREAALSFKTQLRKTKILFNDQNFVCGRYELPNGKVRFEVGFEKQSRRGQKEAETHDHH